MAKLETITEADLREYLSVSNTFHQLMENIGVRNPAENGWRTQFDKAHRAIVNDDAKSLREATRQIRSDWP